MSKKVYIVTSGEYSDYGIEAVFSSKEKADRFIDAAKKGERYPERYSVDEWEVDEMSEAELRVPYYARYDYVTEKLTLWSGDRYDAEWAKKGERARVQASSDFWILVVSFVSTDHAEKYCIEQVQKRKAIDALRGK